jgi:hypothetical protein
MDAAYESAFSEGRLAALREQRDGGYSCPYRSGAKRAAWSRGLAAGRAEITDRDHAAKLAAVPEAKREENKAGFRSAIEAWLEKQGKLL